MKVEFKNIENFYFLGIGGIGMSALARYFKAIGKNVAGYDLTTTSITNSMQDIGIPIHFEDNVNLIPGIYLDKDTTLVIRTPAVPDEHTELQYFEQNYFTIYKRAEVLGLLFNAQKGLAVAGTHGKTTISTLLSFLLHKSGFNNSAFLGGISNNFESNYLIGNSDWLVAEADEFDRSFLYLNPYAAIITAIDADHLDIYKDKEDIEATFNQLVRQIQPGGILIYKKGLLINIPNGIKAYTYSLNESDADFYASKIENINGNYNFAITTPMGSIENLTTLHPGLINVENSIAALALATLLGADEEPLRDALSQFTGIKRRFDVQLQTEKLVYIDDYAHHPRELDAVIGSVKDMYPGKKVTGIFQPHLYSRTRDFADEFAKSLSQLDELYLLDIYPARELPIPGVTSDIIFKDVTISNKHNCSKENLLEHLKEQYIEVLLTLGAGDIDCLVEPIKELVNTK